MSQESQERDNGKDTPSKKGRGAMLLKALSPASTAKKYRNWRDTAKKNRADKKRTQLGEDSFERPSEDTSGSPAPSPTIGAASLPAGGSLQPTALVFEEDAADEFSVSDSEGQLSPNKSKARSPSGVASPGGRNRITSKTYAGMIKANPWSQSLRAGIAEKLTGTGKEFTSRFNLFLEAALKQNPNSQLPINVHALQFLFLEPTQSNDEYAKRFADADHFNAQSNQLQRDALQAVFALSFDAISTEMDCNQEVADTLKKELGLAIINHLPAITARELCALMRAPNAQSSHVEAILEKQYDLIDQQDQPEAGSTHANHPTTPLYYAIVKGRVKFANLLINKAFEQGGAEEVARLLGQLEQGFGSDHRVGPLEYAIAVARKPQLVEALIKHGAQIFGGQHAIDFAMERFSHIHEPVQRQEFKLVLATLVAKLPQVSIAQAAQVAFAVDRTSAIRKRVRGLEVRPTFAEIQPLLEVYAAANPPIVTALLRKADLSDLSRVDALVLVHDYMTRLFIEQASVLVERYNDFKIESASQLSFLQEVVMQNAPSVVPALLAKTNLSSITAQSYMDLLFAAMHVKQFDNAMALAQNTTCGIGITSAGVTDVLCEAMRANTALAQALFDRINLKQVEPKQHSELMAVARETNLSDFVSLLNDNQPAPSVALSPMKTKPKSTVRPTLAQSQQNGAVTSVTSFAQLALLSARNWGDGTKLEEKLKRRKYWDREKSIVQNIRKLFDKYAHPGAGKHHHSDNKALAKDIVQFCDTNPTPSPEAVLKKVLEIKAKTSMLDKYNDKGTFEKYLHIAIGIFDAAGTSFDEVNASKFDVSK